MAKMTPLVRGDRLIHQQHDHEQVLAVETPAWFAWLATASTFAFTSDTGTFTARKERAGNQRGGWYWKAYRTQHGKHSSLYLGKAEALTLERLNAVAQALAQTSNRNVGGAADVERTSPPTEEVEQHVMTTIRGDPPLATKLHVPRPPLQLVRRPHLVERLQQAVERPVTLIAAPAGFGKTTLLSTWLERASLHTAWISLEHDDDDLARFWSYVFTALSRVHPGSGTSALSLLQASPLAPLPPIETVLSVWINELATLPHEMALVLDDYHLITAQPIHRAVTYLVDHLPPQLHLVIATRADPPLPLARLRARGHLTEIRAADLRFTAEEVMAFLTQALGPKLSSEDIAVLEARTEGWIAGLQLAALSLQGHNDIPGFLDAFSGSHRYIIDYLVEEVLARQPEPVQTFLLQTAILERLQGSLCEAVMGVMRVSGSEASGQAMLEQLEQANLFLTPLDDERRWYRYHQLFAEALRHRLLRGQPDLVPELHRRASAWYEQHGLTHEAVYHALTAADFEQAARLIEHAAEMMVKRGEIATLRSWLEALPDYLLRSRVELGLWHGWLLTQTGQFDAAERLLQDLEHQLRPSPTRPPLTAMSRAVQPPQLDEPQRLIEFAGRVAATRAYIAFRRGDDPRTIDLALQALEQLPEDHAFRGVVAWYLGIAYLQSGDLAAGAASLTEARAISQAAGNSYAALMAAYELAQMQARQGYLHQAEQSFQRALELGAERGAPLAATGPLYVGRGDIQREWNHLDTAASFLQEGIAQCQQTGNTSIMLMGHITLARIKQAQGDAVGADRLIQQIAQILRSSHLSPLNEVYGSAWHARLALAQGDLALASRWVQERQLGVDDEPSSSREMVYLTLARVLIAQHKPREALPLLGRLLHLAERDGRMGNALAILVLQALAQQASGDEAGALERLSRALTLAEPEGYIRLFVDEGQPIVALLRQAYARGIATDYVATLLSVAGAPVLAAPAPAHSLLEPLTERELEVIRLLVAGLSNAAMARELFITVGTVKSHINHIYGKLGVQSRSQAIARAHILHLL
jgi:LuxR family transcriptional regulator, maltose regulon positive regulatory protein